MSDSDRPLHQFGDFRLDGSRRLLSRTDGSVVKLTAKGLDTLIELVRQAGSTVEKDDLIRTVWPDTFVDENNLSQKISEIRRALGERQGENRFIVTVPGRGFRFVAEVTEVSPEELPAPSQTSSGASANDRKSRWSPGVVWTRPRAILSLGVLAALLIAAAALNLVDRRHEPDQTIPPIRTVAILPFKPLVPEQGDAVLELGMADTLILRMSNVRELTVRPLSAVRPYGAVQQDPFEAGRELGVDAVLDGSIQRVGERVRVAARLLDTRTGVQLWAEQYAEELTDIFAVQDSIAQRMASELSVRLSQEERSRIARRHTSDPEAYALYIRGRFLISLGQAERAVELLESAVSRDPEYALALAALAEIYSRLPIAADVPSGIAIPKAKAAALEALRIDPGLAEAYTALGWISFYYEWDWAASESNHRQALRIKPNDSSARLGLAHLLSNTGRHDEALREVDRALSLDPHSPLANALKGQFLFHARRYPEAFRELEKSLEKDPGFWVTLVQLGRSHTREGAYDEALRVLGQARELTSTTVVPSRQGYTLAAAGRVKEAEAILRDLEHRREDRYVPPYHLALVHHGLGDGAAAIRLLNQGLAERDVWMVFLGVDPVWDELRQDEGFVDLLARLQL